MVLLFLSCDRTFDYLPKNHLKNVKLVFDNKTNGWKIINAEPTSNDISIPDNLYGQKITVIGERVFKNANIHSIKFNDNLKIIEKDAFRNCYKLEGTLIVPKSLIKIEQKAFYNTEYSKIQIYDSITTIGTKAFNKKTVCEFMTIDVIENPEKENTIELWASNYNGNYLPSKNYDAQGLIYNGDTLVKTNRNDLVDLVIPAKHNDIAITKIQESAFYRVAYPQKPEYKQASLETITIGDNIETIGVNAFAYLTRIKSINFNDKLKNIYAYAFAYKDVKLKNTAVLINKIPQTVEFIGNSAFLDLYLDTSIINLPSVKQVGNKAFYNTNDGFEIPHNKFDSIVFGNKLESLGEYCFYNNAKLETVEFDSSHKLKNISKGSFKDCTKLTTVNNLDTIEVIEDEAFANTNVTTIVLGPNIKRIGSKAFANCKNLTTVTIPASANPTIAIDAFIGCDNYTHP